MPLVSKGGLLAVSGGELFNNSAGVECCCEPGVPCACCEEGTGPATYTISFVGVTLQLACMITGILSYKVVGTLNGTYTLVQTGTGGDCFWEALVDIGVTQYSDMTCTTVNGTPVTQFKILLQLLCVFGFFLSVGSNDGSYGVLDIFGFSPPGPPIPAPPIPCFTGLPGPMANGFVAIAYPTVGEGGTATISL